MEQTPSLSVIIPHLNDQDGLARNLATLVRERQDVPGLEIIVVDNGSSNPPVELVEAHGGVLLHEAEPGPGPARSTGTRAAKAPILAFIDSDCIAVAGWAKDILAYFEQSDAAPIMGGEILIDVKQTGAPNMIEAYECVYNYRQKLYIFHHDYSSTANLAMRAEVFKEVGDFAGISIAEDRDWGRRATALGYKIAFNPHIKIATPARPNLAAVKRKVDRQIGHDFAILGDSTGAKLRWVVKALALVASPVGEVVRIFSSNRISGLRARMLSWLGLTRVRLYRGGLMLKLLFTSKSGERAFQWNSE